MRVIALNLLRIGYPLAWGGDGLELERQEFAECAEDRPVSGYLNIRRSDISVTFRSNRVFLSLAVRDQCCIYAMQNGNLE